MFSRHSLWSVAGGAVPALAAIIAIPILVGFLGFELFAIVSLIISLTIFFFVYDFGVGRAMTFFIPKSEHESVKSAAELVGSALFFSFILGTLATVLIYTLVPYVARHWINIRLEFVEQSVHGFQIAALGILPSLIANTCKGMLEGRAKFREANLCKMFSGATIFLSPLVLVAFGSKNLSYISAAIVASRYLALIMYSGFVICVFDLANVRLKLATLLDLYRYGVWAALSGFISTMFVYGDRFIVARYLNPQQLSIYVASQDILIRYLLIPWSMAVVMMPLFSAGKLSKIETCNLYHTQQKRMGKLSFAVSMMVIFIVLAASPFLSSYGIPLASRNIIIVQVVGVFFCSISQLPLIYLYACGKPRLITMIYGVEALFYLLLAPLIFSHYGIKGACMVWSGRLILEYYLLRFFAERLMK